MKRRLFALAPALACAAWLVAAAFARADVVHLKDGGAIEGKVVSEDSKGVTIDTRFGRQTIEKSRIDRVEKGLTAREELGQRETALTELKEKATAAQWWELAEWAGKKSLRKDRERLIDKTLAVDPNHEGANVTRGRVKHEGRWMTPAERDVLVREAEEAAMLARGLVQWQGRWVTAEEKVHLERGEEQVDGRWLAPDDAKRARGFAKLPASLSAAGAAEEWVPATEVHGLSLARGFAKEASLQIDTARGEHVVAATTWGKEHADALRDACEKGYDVAAGSFAEPPAKLDWLGGQKVLVLVLPERDEFARFCQFFARDEPKVDDRWALSVGKADGFFWWDPTCTSATFRGGRQVEDTVAHTLHHLGHLLLNRHGYNFKFLPTWLDEGYACWLEYKVLGRNAITCVTGGVYAAPGRQEGVNARAKWFQDARIAASGGSDPPLAPILRRDLSTITFEEIGKSMLVIDYVVERRGTEFRNLLAALRKHWPQKVLSPFAADAQEAHKKAFEAFGLPAELLDREVRKSCGGSVTK